jgi:hypothetical protein
VVVACERFPEIAKLSNAVFVLFVLWVRERQLDNEAQRGEWYDWVLLRIEEKDSISPEDKNNHGFTIFFDLIKVYLLHHEKLKTPDEYHWNRFRFPERRTQHDPMSRVLKQWLHKRTTEVIPLHREHYDLWHVRDLVRQGHTPIQCVITPGTWQHQSTFWRDRYPVHIRNRQYPCRMYVAQTSAFSLADLFYVLYQERYSSE